MERVRELGIDESNGPPPDVVLSQLSVLIVDDEPEVLFGLRTGLLSHVGAVYVAQSPLAALWFLERTQIDVVLCDLYLHRADGRHLLDIVRERWPRVARILFTGFLGRVDDHAVFPSAQCVLYKPIDIASLLSLLGPLADDR